MNEKVKKRLKLAGKIFAGILVLLFLAFLYINRGGFIKTHILPIVAEKLGEEVVADDISFSLFSDIEISGLRVGDEPPQNSARSPI